MIPVRKLAVNSVCLSIAASLAMLPMDIVDAATTPLSPGGGTAVDSLLDKGCGSGVQGEQVADAGDDSDAAGGTTTSGTSDAGNGNAAATPVATDTPIPQLTAQPIFGILRGPGTLIAPPATASPGVTAPPVPTASPAPSDTQGPIFLIRSSPAPGASGVPAPQVTDTSGSGGSSSAGTPAPWQSVDNSGTSGSSSSGATNSTGNGPTTQSSNTGTSSGTGSTSGSGSSSASGNGPTGNANQAADGTTGGAATVNGNGTAGAFGGAPVNGLPGSAGASVANGPKAKASGAPGAKVSPSPVPTLGPNQIAVLADNVTGYTSLDQPSDATGNVHVFYKEGVLVGDQAHYDGVRYITVSGNTYLENYAEDTKLYGDTIVFDMITNKAVLKHGRGTTSRGVEKGYIHYTADSLNAQTTGHVLGQHASFSTCENPRGGYHITAKTIDITPGEKLVAKSAIVFLGGIAIFFIPVLSIPLNRTVGQRRPVVFAPEVGYDSEDGFYIRARIGFGTTNTYYGYYRVEEYTKRGLGLGYVAFIGSRNGKRQVNVNLYDFSNNASSQSGSGHQDNLSLQDNEIFTKALVGQFGATYTSEYGPYVSLPPSYSFNGTVNHTSKKSAQSYSFSRTAVGGTQSTINTGFQDSYTLSPATTEALNLNLTENTNSYSGITTPTSSFHINSLTHSSTHAADYTLTVDQTDSATPSGYNKVPEFVFHPHTGHGEIPLDTQLTVGTYHELTPITLANGDTEAGREAQRGEFDLTAGPVLFNAFHSSTVSATVGGSQYYYSTGDLKAQTRQTVNMTTPFGPHISNVIQYQEQNISGPQSLPFQYLDVLGAVNHNAQETLSINNGGIYTLTLTTSTAFDHDSEPISYQLISRPSSRSYLSIGGSYIPGQGNGFSTTNVQVATPFGRDQDLEFTTNVDWKNKGRLEDKNIYFRKIIGNCYDIRVSYNQDLKAVNLSLDLLAFPTHGVNFGFVSQQQAIFPQNFVVQ